MPLSHLERVKITQEALNNALQHGAPTSVVVRIDTVDKAHAVYVEFVFVTSRTHLQTSTLSRVTGLNATFLISLHTTIVV